MTIAIDPLTKLLNKFVSQNETGEHVQTSTGLLLRFDFGSFKLVNDIYENASGDKILIQFDALIRKIIRDDDLSRSMGGDEFIDFVTASIPKKFRVPKPIISTRRY